MTAIAPAPTPQPHTGDVPPGAHPPTSADILRAAGDMGIGTSAATSFAASLQGLAGQARSKGQELAASLEQHAASIQRAGGFDDVCGVQVVEGIGGGVQQAFEHSV